MHQSFLLAAFLALASAAPLQAQTAYAVLSTSYGPGQIAKTSDGGQSWAVLPGYAEPAVLYSIHFTSVDQGYAVGTDRTVVKTTDGGLNWTRLAVPGGYSVFRRVHFHDADIGAVADGYGGVLWTTDGGQTWAEQTTAFGQRPDFVYVLTPQVAFIGTGINSGRVYKTVDAGATWTVDPAFEPAQYRFCSFVDAHEGYIFGAYSGNGTVSFRLYRTLDGGSTWSDIGPAGGIQTVLGAIDFADDQFGLFTSIFYLDDCLYRTTDGGASWQRLIEPQYPRRLVQLDFFSSTEAIAHGLQGFYRTSDRGDSWSLFPSSAAVFDMTTVIPASIPISAPSGDFLAADPVELRWGAGFKSRSYRVQISTDPDFQQIVHEAEVASPTLVLEDPALRPGQYHWRVQATSTSSVSGSFSEPQSFRILPRLQGARPPR